ncbi:MAG: ATP-binding cassette domain-containing protein [Candidatus Heimdallarchaeota archaeon]|nr:MAG: ATP-binding cassette domain-containing protein [Candidatus Heimdallarchaeota archaeon]
MQEFPIYVSKISKKFVKTRGSRFRRSRKKRIVQALDNVDLQVRKGEIFGLLGPNGAGKTTLVKILTTIVIPDSGVAKINGFDVVKESRQARASFGATIGGGERSTYWKMTGQENLIFFGRMYGLSRKKAKDRTVHLLEQMQLTDKAHERVENYSTGMKMKINFARALISDSPVLLFDEPTLGLDPSFARDLRLYIKNVLQKEENKTILLTTHYMAEADQLSDRVSLIDNGKIVDTATPEQLKLQIKDQEVIKIRTTDSLPNRFLEDIPGILEIYNHNDSIRIHTSDSSQIMLSVLEKLKEMNITIKSIDVETPTLEDAFIKLTGRGLADRKEES